MKKYRLLILITLVIICAVVALFVLKKDPQAPFSITNSDYNPNYADAIQQKKPELCQHINYALESGPTDAIYRVYGNEAIETCESQAKAGFFGCECDSEAVLNDMRQR